MIKFDNYICFKQSGNPIQYIRERIETHDIDWNWIVRDMKLPERFIEEFKNYLDFKRISLYQTLSEPFIRKYHKEVDWDWISQKQIISEEFIREFKDVVKWDKISRYQGLSEGFVWEFKGNINWNHIKYNENISQESIKKLINKMNREKIKQNFLNDVIYKYKDKIKDRIVQGKKITVKMAERLKNSIIQKYKIQMDRKLFCKLANLLNSCGSLRK